MNVENTRSSLDKMTQLAFAFITALRKMKVEEKKEDREKGKAGKLILFCVSSHTHIDIYTCAHWGRHEHIHI